MTAGSGLLCGGTSGGVTLAVNAGAGANQIVQLDFSARIPAVDGGLLTNVSAERLQGRTLASIAPASNQVLAWNSGSSLWEPSTPLAGDFKADGSVAMTAALRLADGSTSSPSLTFAADTNTGLYRAGNDLLGAVTNGAERLRCLEWKCVLRIGSQLQSMCNFA